HSNADVRSAGPIRSQLPGLRGYTLPTNTILTLSAISALPCSICRERDTRVWRCFAERLLLSHSHRAGKGSCSRKASKSSVFCGCARVENAIQCSHAAHPQTLLRVLPTPANAVDAARIR